MLDPACIDGVLVIDKPAGPTSHSVVAQVRKLLRSKTGHLGTLDPAATGVLPLVLGRATRLARFMQTVEKRYLATIRLGKTTDTFDGDGQTLSENAVPGMGRREIERVLRQFRGEVNQIPPMFSAVKLNGERLYKAARRGETRDRPKRTVNIFSLKLLEYRSEELDIEVHCSSGTYIRTLASDIGEAIGCGAYLSKLRRTRSGSFDLASAIELEHVAGGWQDALIPLSELLPEFPAMIVDAGRASAVLHGNPIEFEGIASEGTYCRLLHGKELLAVGQVEGPRIQPKVVLQGL